MIDAFMAAAQKGDFEGLVAVLDPDIVLRADGGAIAGLSRVVRGANAVASPASSLQPPAPSLQQPSCIGEHIANVLRSACLAG